VEASTGPDRPPVVWKTDPPGTQGSPGADWPLPGTGGYWWMVRGPGSRAGLIAYPVVPPSDMPIDQTRTMTASAPMDETAALPPKLRITYTSTKVPTISPIRLNGTLRTAGPVLKTASLRPWSSVISKCFQ